MKTPPSHLPPIPEGWVYIGAENEINVTGCEDEKIVGNDFQERWHLNTAATPTSWGVFEKLPHWHYIAPRDSKIARLNLGPKLTFTAGVDFGSRADQPTVSVFAYEELQAERDRWAEATSEQLTHVKRLTAENESLKAQVKHRDSIIQGIKVALNNVMDF